MSLAYCCIKVVYGVAARCDEIFCVPNAARARFEQFHDTHIEHGATDGCELCKNDDYGRVEVCAASCETLAIDSAKQTFKDPAVAAYRDAWVAFLRHCIEHGGYRVQY